MREITIRSKSEFKKAIEDRYDRIIAVGAIAEEAIKQVQRKQRVKKVAKGGGIAAAPFTGGASMFRLTAAATGVAIALTTTQLALILVAITGISIAAFKMYTKITISKDGTTVILER
jgi:glucose uptake protein GlcU